ncbi:MAG: SH3 domain-containing protein [Clostridium sp.]|nr:SH3 domain-containing protein [Clostridium sp.]
MTTTDKMLFTNIHCKKIIVSILVLSFLLMPCQSVQAANDDPGAGRLSGDNIPAEFYEEPDYKLPHYGLSRYGIFPSQSPYTGGTYLHQDIFAARPIIHGIDVSQWQKTIDWTQVKAAGIDFAFIRVGYRGYGQAGTLSEGTKDTYYDTNMQNAIAAGVKVGVYIFSQATTTAEAVEEADYILNHLGSYTISMPLIMDYEYASDAKDGGRVKTAKLSKEEATTVCMAFCNRIAEAGYTPMVYANKSMLEDQLNAADLTNSGYRIWLAHYIDSTTYAGAFDFWQYSSAGKVSGIEGNVDMNFYYSQPGDSFSQALNSINAVSVTPIPNQSYTGKALTPNVTLTHQGQPLQRDVDYTLEYQNNKNLGTAAVTIKGMGSFNGSRQIFFKIVPGSVGTVKAKKRANNYITLSWKKNSKVNGYQIYRSTSLDGTYKKIKSISSKSTVTFKNTGLNSGQCYYYKVRSYMKSGGKTYYGDFSPLTTYTKADSTTKTATAKTDSILYSCTTEDAELYTVTPIAAGTAMPVTYLTLDEYGDTWYYVTCQQNGTSYKGYVPAASVTVTEQGKVANTKTVNVRKSASITSKKLTTLKKNKKVTILSSKKKKGMLWYKVTFKKNGDDYTGWIASPYIKKI